MPRPGSSDSDETPAGGSSLLEKWCKCHCGKIRLVNERCFMAPPLITFGSSLAEFVVVFSITGFMAIDVIAVSAVCFSILLSLAALLYIRFDRLTLLAFLMLSVALLSCSTFLIICIQKQSNVHESEVGSAQQTFLASQHPHSHHSASISGGDDGDLTNNNFHHNQHHANQSRHGSKLVGLMKSGTELRWMHQLQSKERCCGFWNFKDWIGEDSLLESNKTFTYHSEPIHPPTQWMVSCCDRNLTKDHTNCIAESIYDDWHDIVQFLFQRGCGSRMDDKYDEVNFELLKTSIGLSLWNLLIAIDVIVYTAWRKLRSKAHNACNGGRNGAIATDDDDVFT